MWFMIGGFFLIGLTVISWLWKKKGADFPLATTTPKDCGVPCTYFPRQQAAVFLSGELLDLHTASIVITNIFGTQNMYSDYRLGIWQSNQPGLWKEALHGKNIRQGNSGKFLFSGLNINRRKGYTLGLQVGLDSLNLPNICATLTITPGICPPQSLDGVTSSVQLENQFLDNLLISYRTFPINDPKKGKHWVGIMDHGLRRGRYPEDSLLAHRLLKEPYSEDKIILKCKTLKRKTSYLLLYGMGGTESQPNSFSPNLDGAIASFAFQTP